MAKPSKEAEREILNTMCSPSVEHEGDEWHVKGINFESVLKNRADAHETFSYIENGRRIGFSCDEIRWSNGETIQIGADASEIVRTDVAGAQVVHMYTDAFGPDINIKIVQDNYKWQKIVEIESFKSLGWVPTDAEYLEISFKISGDFDVPDGGISDPVLFGEDSFLQPVRVWDSAGSVKEDVAVGVVADDTITKRIPVEWLKSAAYPVEADLTITFGAENVFNAATTTHIYVAALDLTHFVAVYKDEGNSSYGTARVGVVSGTTISSYGAESVFNAASTGYTSVAALDSTHFVVAYRDEGNSNRGTARIGVISGTTISSWGAENVFNAASTLYTFVAALDSTHFVVTYRNHLGYGLAIVGVVSGTTISSYGPPNVFNTAWTAYNSVAALDATHFVVTYVDFGNSSYGTAIVGVVSGTTISSYGSANVFNAGATSYCSVASLDSTHFVVAYRDEGNSDYGTTCIGVVSGTTISSYGAESVFNSATTLYTHVAALDSTHYVVAYRDVGNSLYGTAVVGLVSGTTTSSYCTAKVFNPASTMYIYVDSLDSTYFVIAYQDAGNANRGTAIIGKVVPSVTFVPQIIII